VDAKTEKRIVAKLEAQARARKRAAERAGADWVDKPKTRWNEKCLRAFLKARPLAEGADPDIHCRVLLIVASAAKAAGISASAGHIGRFAARLFDQIADLIVKARKYDESQTQETVVVEDTEAEAVADTE
jgi:hypothetical protein